MPTWKVFLTMEFEAEIEAETEDEAREVYEDKIETCLSHWGEHEHIKRWWGGANEIKKTD